MTYRLKYGTNTITEELTSFFFYMPFTTQPNQDGTGNLLSVITGPGACHLAILIDGQARFNQPSQPFGPKPGHHTVTIDHQTNGTIVFSDLKLVSYFRLHRNAEWAHMALFNGVKPTTAPSPSWINAAGWNRGTFTNFKLSENWTRTFDFEGIKGAPIDEAVVRCDDTGAPTQVTLVRRMIKNTICDELLKASTAKTWLPKLTISTSSNDQPTDMPAESFFTQASTGNLGGYAMIAAGAFAAVPADTMLRDWRQSPDGIAAGIRDSTDLEERLTRAAWAPENVAMNPKRMLRKLNNIHDERSTGVFAGSGLSIDPVEVIYVESSPGVTIV